MRKEMFSIRVARPDKARWDDYATKLGTDTSTMVRTVVNAATTMPPEQFATFFKVEEPEDG